MKSTRQFFRDMFSENGNGSGKRLVGTIAMLFSLLCIGFLVITEGGTIVVENLLEVVIITAGGLLGISSITGIWKKNSNIKENEEKT